VRERSVPRVVMVIARFYPTVGGTERQAFNLSKALVAKDVPVQVIAGKSKGLWPSHEHVADIPVWRYPAWRSYVFGLATALWRLRHTYDLIHVHQMLYPAWVAGVMGRWLGKPVIAKASNSGERFDLHLLKASLPVAGRLMAEAMPRLLTRVIAIATPIVEDLQAAGFSSQQIVPIPNGVALAAALSDESRRQARQQLGLPADVPLLIFTGTYTPKKNLSLLLRAMARVRARGHLCELLLVGDGPERRQLEALADGSGLRSAVHFTGLAGRGIVQRVARGYGPRPAGGGNRRWWESRRDRRWPQRLSRPAG
jgi:glycosyltransferase involved in cell wall biosynthesis